VRLDEALVTEPLYLDARDLKRVRKAPKQPLKTSVGILATAEPVSHCFATQQPFSALKLATDHRFRATARGGATD